MGQQLDDGVEVIPPHFTPRERIPTFAWSTHDDRDLIVEGTSEPEPADNTVVETDAEVVTPSDEIIAGSEIQIETDIQQSSSQIFALYR